jgi:hypothetical protein
VRLPGDGDGLRAREGGRGTRGQGVRGAGETQLHPTLRLRGPVRAGPVSRARLLVRGRGGPGGRGHEARGWTATGVRGAPAMSRGRLPLGLRGRSRTGSGHRMSDLRLQGPLQGRHLPRRERGLQVRPEL